jgi:hypothetical protein
MRGRGTRAGAALLLGVCVWLASCSSEPTPAGDTAPVDVSGSPAAGSPIASPPGAPPSAVSSSIGSCTVPDVVGLALDDATHRLVDAQCAIGAVTAGGGGEAGTVVSQSPGAGTESPAGTPVDVVVAQP